MKTAVTVLVCVFLSLAVSAQAGMMEMEPNNTLGTANGITVGERPWAEVGIFSLDDSGRDVDFGAIDLAAGEYLTVVTTPIASTFDVPDTVMGLFDSAGTLLVLDDDSGNDGGSFGSTIQYQAPVAGTYTIAVTGYGDRNFDGLEDSDPNVGHGQIGSYIFTVSVVHAPEPATLAFLAMTGLGLVVRRK